MIKRNTNNTTHLPMAFYKLPIAVQVVFQRLRQLVDRFAFIDCRTGVIKYTRKDTPKVKRVFTKQQSQTLFNDLYRESV